VLRLKRINSNWLTAVVNFENINYYIMDILKLVNILYGGVNMFKKLKSTISILLTLIIMCSTILAQTLYANAESELRVDDKINFNFISTESDNTEYTYEEYGKQYKVLETSTEDFDNIHTEVFVKDDNNEYILIEKYDTVISMDEDNNIEITKLEDGKQTTDIMVVEDTVTSEPIKNARSGWEFVNAHNGSTHFQNFTYSVVAGILVSLVSGGLGLGIVAGSVVGAVAGIIVSERVPTVYYRRTVSYYRNTSNMVTKVRANNNFYYDSGHRTYLGNATNTWTGKFPW